MIYPMLLGQVINSVDFCFSEKKKVFSKCEQQNISRTQLLNRKDAKKIIPNSMGNVRGCNQLCRVAGKIQKREPTQGIQRKRISQENIEGCSKCIILRNESHFKLSSETNTNQVKGTVVEGKTFLSPKA